MKNSLLYVLVGFFAGGLVVVLWMSFVNSNQLETVSEMESVMSGMTHGLEGKEGMDFDKAFLSEMIIHHKGAIDMAEQALLHAGKTEIKKMAEDIINLQSEEIKQMEDWMKEY